MNLPQAKSELKTALRLWYQAYCGEGPRASRLALGRLYEAYKALLIASNQKRWDKQNRNTARKAQDATEAPKT